MAQDSSRPDFWDTRYQSGVTPWEGAGIAPQIEQFVDGLPAASKVLVPGCGSAADVLWLAGKDFAVDAIDFSAEAIARAKEVLKDVHATLKQADFFALPESEPYDMVFERAFLCALPPHLWPDYAQKMGRLIRPGGMLAGLFFLAEKPKGPPFGASMETLQALFSGLFELRTSLPVEHSLPVFAGQEHWMVWQRV